jgi:hypothetical protein
MKRIYGILLASLAIAVFAGLSLTTVTGCGGGGSTPTPTPTPSQVFPNDTANAQSPPIKLGTSGGNTGDVGPKFCCIGTLGSLWTRADIPNPVILSNNHVLNQSDNGKAAPGDPIVQPLQLVCNGGVTPLTVAHLTQAAKLKPGINETTQPCAGDNTKAALCGQAPDNVDAAIAEIVPGQVDTSGLILDQGAVGASSIAAAAPSSTLGLPSISEAVSKSGRTSGLTCSTVESLNTTILIDYDATCGDTTAAFTAYFRNQMVVAGGSFSASGDSGSLIVDTNTARAVGLLYGGNTTSTTANLLVDTIDASNKPAPGVISRLSNAAGTLTIVGGPDHSISCARTASATNAQVGTAQSALIPAERQRVAAVQKARMQSLMRDFGLASVEIGPSADNPSEGALILHVSGKSVPAVPAVIDGVRTRLVFDNAESAAHVPRITQQQFNQSAVVKEAHVSEFLGKGGIQGMGVSASSDNPTEPAISFYTTQGIPHPAIPPMLDGIRTKVFEGTRFKAY